MEIDITLSSASGELIIGWESGRPKTITRALKYFQLSLGGGAVMTGSAKVVYYYTNDEVAQAGAEKQFLKIFKHDGNDWVEISFTIDMTANTITFELSSFSSFVIADSRPFYAEPLFILIIGLIVTGSIASIIVYIKKSKTKKVEKKYLKMISEDKVDKKKAKKDKKAKKVERKVPKAKKTIEFEDEIAEEVPMKEAPPPEPSKPEIPELEPISITEFSVETPEYENKSERDMLHFQLQNMKDMAIQLEEALNTQQISQEAYSEQKIQYKTQYDILSDKYNDVTMDLNTEMKNDLLATKESLAFLWVNNLDSNQEIYDIKTGVIPLKTNELQELIKYLNSQHIVTGSVRRVGLRLNEHELYIVMIFGKLFSKTFIVFKRNPGQIIDITIKQLAESIEENFNAIVRNPNIIAGNVVSILFQNVRRG
jgi:hypothetical protein